MEKKVSMLTLILSKFRVTIYSHLSMFVSCCTNILTKIISVDLINIDTGGNFVIGKVIHQNLNVFVTVKRV